MTDRPPFVVFSLPRSRSAWLSQFLSYRDWTCGHDQLRYMRSLDDVKAWLRLENTGSCETAGAPFWRLLKKYTPDCRIVTIRRPIEEVVESLVRVGLDDIPAIRKVLTKIDSKLDQIEGRMSNVRVVQFSDLKDEIACAELFEYLLPYGHDHEWWSDLNARNVQINLPALLRYAKANATAIAKLTAQARLAMLKDFAIKPAEMPGITIRQEGLDDLIRDCRGLFQQHCAEVGEHPDNWVNKNIPLMRQFQEMGILQIMIGRSNGKAFGYLMTVICPSLEEENRVTANNAAFYASPEVPGLGLKLQRASLAALKERGVHETFMRAGIRGDGDRMDVLYRRLGGQDFGRMYRVEMAA